MKVSFSLSLVLLGGILLQSHDVLGQFWPPNKRNSYVAGSQDPVSSLNQELPRFLFQERDDDLDYIEVGSLDELKRFQSSVNIKLGINRELGVANQNLGDNLGNNLFASISLSSRPLSFTLLSDFIKRAKGLNIAPPNREFAYVQQVRYYYEPELSYFGVEFNRFQTDFSVRYIELFPLAFKVNLDRFFSIGAGVGFSQLIGADVNGQNISSPGDNGFDSNEAIGLIKASYYFNSPVHLDLRYSFRAGRYNQNRLPINTFQLAVGYSFIGKVNPLKRAEFKPSEIRNGGN